MVHRREIEVILISFLELGYDSRFNGRHKTVFRNDTELVYTVNPDDLFKIIDDEEWYDNAVLQVKVWQHNIDQILEHGVKLTFESYEPDMMFYDINDDRVDGRLVAPALRVQDYEYVEPYKKQTTFENITDFEKRQIRDMQDKLDELIEGGRISVQERELRENDFRGPGCLRQWGRTEEREVYLLEFGELYSQIEGPLTPEDFLEEHDIERDRHGVSSPVMLGDFSSYIWSSP